MSTRPIIASIRPSEAHTCDAVRLSIQGRGCVVAVSEVPDGVTVPVGQMPLEDVDWVVDPQDRALIGNPAHGCEWLLEMD